MNEVLKVVTTNDRITVSARELHDFLESQERFSKWFERMASYGLDESEDYTPYQKVHPQNMQVIDDYQLTIDAAKEISMLQRTEKGKEARKYFIEVEKRWNSPTAIMARALLNAQDTIENLGKTIEMQKPKVEFFDQVACSKDAIEMSEVAKTLNIRGVGRNKLFEILRDKKILMDNNIPYQKYCDRGYFRVIEQKYNRNGEVRISLKTLVYQRGLDYIRKVVGEN